MLWQNIKSWCKEKGYKADRSKVEDGDSYIYRWYNIDNPEINGETTSVSKLAKSIFNIITDNRHVEHQEEFSRKKQQEDIQLESGY